ncbi:Vacuolar protein sorting-associated protein 13 [Microsporum audouinii]
MLEGIVANLLNRFLGMYVKNFDAGQLNVGIWSGDVKLRDLELRREALDQLHLPLNVIEGHLGELTLSIPWSNLRGKPVKVHIQDVFLLAAPKEDSTYDPEEEKRREHAVKMEKLESAELIKEQNTAGMSQEEQQKNQSFTQSLITAIVNNLQVTIKNVHFRYEDGIAAPGHPFAVGVTIKELSAVSTDSDWKPTFIQSTSTKNFKLAVLNSLAIYWNTDAELFAPNSGDGDNDDAPIFSHADLLEKFRDAVATGENNQYILKPVSGKAGLELDTSLNVDHPRAKAKLIFDELGFVLDDHQYRDALMLVDLFHYFIQHREYRSLMPECRPKEDPRAWFRFAGQAILSKIHERNRKWTWGYIKERRDNRIRYIELFKMRKREDPMSPAETEEMKALEEKLSYEDLRFWRSLARNQLRKERIECPKKVVRQQTWSEWIWGTEKKEEDQHTSMTEEQRQELYQAIDWDEKKAIADAVDMPRDSVKFQIDSSLRAGSFTLKRDPHGGANEILKLVFESFQAKALQRPDSFLIQADLGGLRLFDHTTNDTAFPQIVRVKDCYSMPSEDVEEITEMDIPESPDVEDIDRENDDSLFYLQFESNPLDGSADSALRMKLKSLEVIYTPKVLVEIVKFFRPPERHMESIGALLETAGATVAEIRQQTRAGLEFALEEHKTINAQLDIQAPLIIVPESITTDDSMCLIFDAGRVSVSSKLADKETLKMVQNKQGSELSNDDLSQLESLMYDKFLLKLDSTQVLIGNGIEATKAQLDSKTVSKNLHIMDRINMDFVLELCIAPKSTLTRTRISGHLPEFHASMSDTKYKNLMRLIDIAIPQFNTDGPADSAKKEAQAEATALEARARSQSIQFRQKDVPVLQSENDIEGPEEKISTDSQSPKNIHRRLFEFKFTVDTLRGSLYRSDTSDESNDRLLVELVAEHFHLDYNLREYDMAADIVLKSLSIEDYIEEHSSAPEFKEIVTSRGFDANEDKDLFTLKFIKVNPNSPEFISVYDGVEMNLELLVSTINLIVTRKTLLTLLDFVLITFTNQNSQNQVQSSAEQTASADSKEAPKPANTGKIRISSKLERISLILNDDGVRLATLSLNTADVGIFLADETMQIQSRMGSLTLFDDINDNGNSSTVRRLMSIEGEDFADFRYQTFNPKLKDYPGYDSEVVLRSGSIKINFIDEPYRRVINFLVKFGKMQSIFNAARQAAANQASQIQESSSLMHFDIVVMTPILVFPRITDKDGPRDFITAHLGEIYASNQFSKADYDGEEHMVNAISAGVRHIRLTSTFYFSEDVCEELEMIEKVDMDFNIRYTRDPINTSIPVMRIDGLMSPTNLRISQMQFKFLLELSKTIPAAFTPDQDLQEGQAQQALPELSAGINAELDSDKADESKALTDRSSQNTAEPRKSIQLELGFRVETVGLELLLVNEDAPVQSLDDASLSKFFLSDTNVKLRMLNDGSLESELLIHSFNVRDSRSKETNRFRKIMSLVNTDVQQQFMASVSMSGGTERQLVAIVTIDSPRIIFAVDYLFSLKSFATAAFPAEPTVDTSESSDEESTGALVSREGPPSKAATVPSSAMTADNKTSLAMSFRFNMVDSQVILVANPTIPNTEAIVLGAKQIVYSQQNASTLQISNVGMFLCRMDKFETSRLRILDDFSLELSMDTQSKSKVYSTTRIDVHVEPLILRLSPRDILLALQIMNRVSEMTSPIQSQNTAKESKAVTAKPTQADLQSPSTPVQSRLTAMDRIQQSAILKKEEMCIQMDGIRVILIGDVHILPLLDWNVQSFRADVRDWSANMSADTTFDTFINVYNFSKSTWEPLIEPWQLGFHMSKELSPDIFSIDAYSHKNMELTVTSATIALASKTMQFLSADEDVLSKPRGTDTPYRIRNYTGFELRVWADTGKGEEGHACTLEDGEEYPWRFEDPTTMRENLTPEGNAGTVGIKLEGSGFDSISRIPLIREGETLYNLKPKKDKVLHKLLVEVTLGADYVKYITFRSPLVVENRTQIPVEVGVFSPAEGHLLKIEKILPGDSRPAPVGAAYLHSLVVRPDQGFGYDWSNERLFWKDLLKRPTRTLKCQSESGQHSPPFYFQMNATFDRNDPLLSVYPYMRIRVSAPIEIQNLLPYDFKYRIYDKNLKKDWTNFLRKGGVSPVHVVELSHVLLLSIDMQDTAFRQCEFAIVNGNVQEDFRRETTLIVQDDQGQELKLGLHYFTVPDSGGAFKVSVFSPYLVLNKTGLDLNIQSKSVFHGGRAAAGRAIKTDVSSGVRSAIPYMYSYQTDDHKNRSVLRVNGSSWSKPQSFEAIGSSFEVTLPASNGRTEYHAGVTVEEGTGKYKVTKIVTVSPRFILENRLDEELVAREPGSPNVITLKPGDLVPLHFLRQSAENQLCFCFPGVNNQWSSLFNIADLGITHVKLAKANQRQRLLKVEILMEGATIFLRISMEAVHWPFSMKNESDAEFIFFQANPNISEDEDDRSTTWRPIRYRLPPRSIMPYAWDYPAAKNKSLVLLCRGKERYIKLAEMGNLIPMKLPPTQDSPQKIIDIRIEAEGPTQTLVLSNFRPSRSIYRQQKPASSQTSVSTGFEVKEVNSDITFKAQLRLNGIGISLVNQNLKELVYITFREIDLKFSESKIYQTINTTIKWIQIDNQLYGGIFPILLYPSVVPKTGKEMEAHPIFTATVTRVKDDSYGVLYVKYASLLVQQMTLELDEDFIFALLDFVKVPGASWSEEHEDPICEAELGIPEPKTEAHGQDVYFEVLHLHPMQLDLSFVRTERVNVEDTTESSNPLMFFVNVMTMSIGNVNDAPVRLNALLLENARVSIPMLVSNITNHYTQEFLRQVHVVIGSADFLGNPVGLFNTVSSGVADIFYEPYQGFVMSDRPQELGLGIAKGATSFVKKSVFGISDSLTKFTGSVSKGLAAATLDKEFQDQRRMSRARNRPKHALYGVTAGGSAFASSMASGIGGLARHPLEGAEKEGFQGFVKGVGKGFLGLATKPALGAFDLASNLAEGVRNTTTVFDAGGLDRVRLTRFIGRSGIVKQYSQREALGQFWLKTTDDGKYFNEEYIAHLEFPGKDMLVLLTYDRIMLVRSKRLTTEWDIKLTDIQKISKERTGMTITLKGGTNGPFIPVQDESGRNWFYKQIAIAVNAFNEKYSAKG